MQQRTVKAWLFVPIALTLALPALAIQPMAVPPNTVCRVEEPQVPAIGWSGQARYRALAVVKNGRVVSVEITALTSGVDRRAQRSLVQAIERALRASSCEPGDHEFEQTFSFDIPKPPAAS